MKRICVLFLSLIPLFAFSQIIDDLPKNNSGEFCVSKTIVSEKSKTDLYLFAKQFLIDKTYSDLLDGISIDDKEAGILLKKGYFRLDMGNYRLYYSLKIQLTEGQLKYELYDFFYYDDYFTRSYEVDFFFSKDKYYKRNGSPKSHNEKLKLATLKAIDDFNLLITNQLSKY